MIICVYLTAASIKNETKQSQKKNHKTEQKQNKN